MKFQATLIIGAMIASSAIARPVSSCSDQANCLKVDFDFSACKSCDIDEACVKVSLKWNNDGKKRCIKSTSDTISHSCPIQPNGDNSKQEGWNANSAMVVQNAKIGGKARFGVKDGSSCYGPGKFSISNGAEGVCNGPSNYCSGRNSKECEWIFEIPKGKCKTPMKPTEKPTKPPTKPPKTKRPTSSPTEKPTDPPTKPPKTKRPTSSPTEKPTDPPTKPPKTKRPTSSPTEKPTDPPTKPPKTKRPTSSPTTTPPTTKAPTNPPTPAPTSTKPPTTVVEPSTCSCSAVCAEFGDPHVQSFGTFNNFIIYAPEILLYKLGDFEIYTNPNNIDGRTKYVHIGSRKNPTTFDSSKCSTKKKIFEKTSKLPDGSTVKVVAKCVSLFSRYHMNVEIFKTDAGLDTADFAKAQAGASGLCVKPNAVRGRHLAIGATVPRIKGFSEEAFHQHHDNERRLLSSRNNLRSLKRKKKTKYNNKKTHPINPTKPMKGQTTSTTCQCSATCKIDASHEMETFSNKHVPSLSSSFGTSVTLYKKQKFEITGTFTNGALTDLYFFKQETLSAALVCRKAGQTFVHSHEFADGSKITMKATCEGKKSASSKFFSLQLVKDDIVPADQSLSFFTMEKKERSEGECLQ